MLAVCDACETRGRLARHWIWLILPQRQVPLEEHVREDALPPPEGDRNVGSARQDHLAVDDVVEQVRLA